MLDITVPDNAEPLAQATHRAPRKLDHASINSLAYDLVTGCPVEDICSAYMITLQQLLQELKTNIHLQHAVKTKKQTIQVQGSFTASVEAVASETLPYILRDNTAEDTEPAVRSRNMAMLMSYQTAQAKIMADLEKVDKGAQATMGVQVNFNVSQGIRGISAPTITKQE